MNNKSINVKIVGVPIPQGSLVGNPRFGGLRYSNDVLLKEWRAKVIDALADAMPSDWDISAPVIVMAVFKFVKPKGHYGVKGLRKTAPKHKSTKPDLDKLARGVGDSCEQSGVIRNDSQIIQWVVQKQWARDQEPPGVTISINPAEGVSVL